MIDKFLSNLNIQIPFDNLTEIRLRKDLPITYFVKGEKKKYKKGGVEVIFKEKDLQNALSILTQNSYYSFEEQFAKGFINFHGAKVSLGGEGLTEKGKLVGIKNVSSICVRVPKIVDCVDLELAKEIYSLNKNVAIIGKTSSGKTTYLRDLIKNCPYNITVMDEKGELYLTPTSLGENADVLTYISKQKGIELAIRGLNPTYIALDEVYHKTDVDGIKQAQSKGVKIIATFHSDSMDGFLKEEDISKLFNVVILLENYSGKYFVREVKRL